MKYDFTLMADRLRFYKSTAWCGVNGVRDKVVERDGYECVWCKRDGLVTTRDMGKLEVDHIIPLEDCTYEQALDMDNLRTLCTFHHNFRHKRFINTINQRNKWSADEKW
jgi:5-methylcytosine-specific restriction endonuclease McrA